MRKLIVSSVVLMAASQSAFADAEYIDRARVLSVAPQVQQVNQPRQECQTAYVQERVYESNRSNTGAIVGGVAGGYALQYLGGQMTFMLAAAFPLAGLLIVALGLKLTHTHQSGGMFG